MPAQVMSMADTTLYAMVTTDGKWAMFYPDENEIRLSEKVRDACLFRKFKKDPKKECFRILIQVGDDTLQLRAEGKRILEDEDEESTELSFVAWPEGDNDFVSITRLRLLNLTIRLVHQILVRMKWIAHNDMF